MRYRIAGIIGNILENYDKALFGLLAPFIAPLFFHESDPLTALILTYAILPIGALARPIGSLFFGWIGDHYGRKEALYYSLLGMAVVTVLMGYLPTARDVGGLAPLLLGLARMLQNFFAAGEGPGGAIFVLEQTQEQKRSIVDGFFSASSIVGILLASSLVTLLSISDLVQEGWRWLFWLGGLTGFVGLFLRRNLESTARFVPEKQSVVKVLVEQKRSLFLIIMASGFSYVTYSLSFTFMNGFVPLLTEVTLAEVMQANTALLVVDMLLLPFFGLIATQFGKEKLMMLAAALAFGGAVPLFLLLPKATLATVIFVRVAIIVCGVAFAAPYHAWAIEQVPIANRYTILSVGGSLGALLLGTPCSALSLWLYKTVNWQAAPALYLMLTAALGISSVYLSLSKIGSQSGFKYILQKL